MVKKFEELLENNVIGERLKDNTEYQNNLTKLDFGFYLLKKYIPKEKVNILLKCDSIVSNIELTEGFQYFKEGFRQAGLG